ncbi:MAG: DUF1932 domain-containing protein [Burkholderiaceae bacterium]
MAKDNEGNDISADEILLLHPGDMGSALGAVWRSLGHRVYWLPEGRNAASHQRAEAADLTACTLAQARGRCSLIVSVCPPHAARELAQRTIGDGYRGTYLDANAVSPTASAAIGEMVTRAGATYVDGGIIGPPPRDGAAARLYLSGAAAASLAPRLQGGRLTVHALEGGPTRASALKMAFAAWNKGLLALLADVHALADAHDVLAPLRDEWAALDPDVRSREGRMLAATLKAWRWEGEMHEIADTFKESGLPDAFHRGAAEVYRRLGAFKDAAAAPALEEVNRALRGDP